MRSLKKIIAILFVSFLLVKISAYFLDKGFKNYYSPFFEKMDYIFKANEYNDIIYMGNSRANYGINPYFIDSICETRSYNLSLGGTDIAGNLSFLRSYLAYHPAPKYLLYTYDYEIFELKNLLGVAPVYFYYAQHKPVRDQLKQYNYHATFLQFLPDLKFCFFDDYFRTCIVKGLNNETMSYPIKNYRINKKLYDHRGFINYHFKGLDIFEKQIANVPQINSEGISLINTLISICNQNKIKLVFIYPPEFYAINTTSEKVIQNRKIIDSTIADLCKKNNFYYARFDTGNSLTRDDFKDPVHVNIKGAEKYSVMLGNYLQTIYK